MARIFATCDIGSEALARVVREGHELEVWSGDAPPGRDVLADRAARCEALICTLRDPVDAGVLEAGRGVLRVVAQDAVGLDNVDVAKATELGIVVTNTPDVLTEATAEFALFMLGDVSRRLAPSERLVREGRWGAWHPSLPFLGDEVTGRTVAVVGCGRIGRAFAGKCTGLDMNLLLVGRVPPGWLAGVREVQEVRARTGVGRPAFAREAALDDALAQADYVSLHVPLVRQGERATWHLLDERRLRLMKPTAYLVNAARGPVVDEAALARCLREGVLAGAALDVFEKEPLPADSPLLAPELAERVRVYHHFGSGTRQTRLGTDPETGMAGRCVEGCLDALSARPAYRFAVNPPR